MERHQKRICLRVPSHITQGMKRTTPWAARKWLNNMADFVKKEWPGAEDILDDPSRIFNIDETGFAFDANGGRVLKVIAEKGARQVNKKSVRKKFKFFFVLHF